MSWFSRKDKGIQTPTEFKREAPDGLWYQCPSCKKAIHTREHRLFAYTCSSCNYHEKIGSQEYFELLFDMTKYTELDAHMGSGDPLSFVDTKKYTDRVASTELTSGLKDAVRSAYGEMNGNPITIAAMDFSFIGGSMGSVVGEKISRAIDHSLKTGNPFLMISRSGGARMMEAGFSLMQMAKTSARLGGVTASYAMLGDFNIAEPGALIGFAGPRVIRETIGKDLPKGFQSSDFVLDHGFLDFIVDRKDLKDKLSALLTMLK
jgi:acetyl-CoA carboxylase carboxyl transferase subunit beta